MASFQLLGKSWPVTITVGTIRRVKAATGVDLYRLFDPEAGLSGLESLLRDVVKFVDVVYVVVQDQAQKLKIDDVAFGESLAGDDLDQVVRAFLDGVADFFPGPQQARIKRLLGKMGEIQTELGKRGDAMLDAMPTAAEMANAALASPSSSTASPAKSASTQAPSPFAN